MNSISLALFIIGSCLVYLLWKQKRRNIDSRNESTMKLKVPHGPISLPLIGNILQLGDRPYETMVKWSKKYGPVYRVRLGSQEVVVLNGTEIIRDALINHSEGKLSINPIFVSRVKILNFFKRICGQTTFVHDTRYTKRKRNDFFTLQSRL